MNQYGQNTSQFANQGNAAAGQANQAAANQYGGVGAQGSLAGQAGSLGLQAGAQTSQNAATGGTLGLNASGQAGTNANAGGTLGLAATGQAAQNAQAQAAAAAASNAGVMSGIGQAAGAAGSLIMSDENQKKNITSSKGNLDELLRKIRPVDFKYRESSGENPEPEHTGVIAQDLEKTPLASTVVDTPQGKQIDSAALNPALLNLILELAGEVRDIRRGKKDA